MKRVKVWERLLSLILTFCLIVSMSFQGGLTAKAAGYSYNVSAAIAYAEAHWNDGVGLCAEFVSKCVRAGGISIPVKTLTNEVYDSVIATTGVQGQWLTLTSNGYALYSQNSDKLAKGDIVISWCEGYGHTYRPHIMLCGGYDSAGYATFYAHNNPRHNARVPASSGTCGVCGRKNGSLRAKVLHISDSNADPKGWVDEITGGKGKIHVRGWAFDTDNISANIDVHVYIGGSAGASGAECHIITANTERTDVNAVHGCGNYHGFDAYIQTSKIGTQEVHIYAINTPSGNNPEIGSGTVTITPNLGNKIDLGTNFDAYISDCNSGNYVTNDNTNVSCRTYTGGDNQKWHFTKNSDGSYTIKSVSGNGMCLDAYGGTGNDHDNVQVYEANATNAQKWFIYSTGSEGYHFMPACTQFTVMDVKSASKESGANIQLFTVNRGQSNQSFKVSKIHTHSYTATVTKQPTCTTTGVKTYKCSCGTSYTKTIAAKGHTVVTDKAVAATCTTAGKTDGTHCSVCNTVIKAQTTVAATGHNYGEWITTTQPTYTTVGEQTRTCTICGETETRQIQKIKESTTEVPATEAPTTETPTTKTPSTGTSVVKLPTVTNKVSNAAKGVNVKWSRVKSAKGYIVYRKAKGAKRWTRVNTITRSSTVSFVDTKAKSGTVYYYQVKAYGKNGSKTVYSAAKVSAAIRCLKAPTKVSVAKKSSGLKVTWTKTTGAKGYIVYRKVKGSNKWTRVKTVKSAKTVTYIDKTAKKGKTYTYRVKAYNGKSYSAVKTSKSIKK